MLQCSSRGGVLLGPGGVCLVPRGVVAWSGGVVAWSWGGWLPGQGVVAWSKGWLPGPGGWLPGPGGVAWSGGGGCLVQGGDPPPVNRITDTCKNITLATTSLRPVKIPSEIARRYEGCLQIRTSRNMLLEICVQLFTVLHVTL